MRLMLCVCSLLMLFYTNDKEYTGAYGYIVSFIADAELSGNLSAMDALDLVKWQYGVNFEKIYLENPKDDKNNKDKDNKDKDNKDKDNKVEDNKDEDNKDEGVTWEEYYYKLPFADYYLVYEGQGKTENDYLFHLYEFVLDEPETGIGHIVTYGWYTVDKKTGIITEETQ